MKTEILRMDNITKYEASEVHLNHVRINVYKGETVGLLGLHNTGKTLLMNILMGIADKNHGMIYIQDIPVEINSVHDANHHGIYYINTVSSLINSFSIADNIFFTRHSKKSFFIHKKEILRDTKNYIEQLQLPLDPYAQVSSLSHLERLYVEIVRLVSINAKLIIIDHALSLLNNKELQDLYSFISRLNKLGLSFLLVDYRPTLLTTFCERIFVLRKGSMAGEFERSQYDEQTLTAAMVGYEIPKQTIRYSSPILKNALLEFPSHTWKNQTIPLSISYGEIIGLCTMSTPFKHSLLSFFQGENLSFQQKPLFEGKLVSSKTLSKIIKKDFGILSYQNTLFDNMSLYDNIMLLANRKLSNMFGLIPKGRARYIFNSLYSNYFYNKINIGKRTRCNNLDHYTEIIIKLAKHLAANKKLLICTDLTRYTDIIASQQLLHSISSSINDKLSALVISSDIHELIQVCDRIYFYNEQDGLLAMDKKDYTTNQIFDFYQSFFIQQ